MSMQKLELAKEYFSEKCNDTFERLSLIFNTLKEIKATDEEHYLKMIIKASQKIGVDLSNIR
jgi:hypothetical protein